MNRPKLTDMENGVPDWPTYHIKTIFYIDTLEAERDTLQAQLTEANRLLQKASGSLLAAHMEKRLRANIADHLNPPKENT